MNGTHAQLAVRPHRDCHLRRLDEEYDVREFTPARNGTPAQFVIETERLESLPRDPVLRPVVETERAVVCRVTREPGGADTPHDGADRCLATGFDPLPVEPYTITWADGGVRVTIAAADAETVQECVATLEDGGLSVTVETVGLDAAATTGETVLVDLVELTDRQRETAELAVERGYYRPGGASAAELADELDVSKATVSEHLRTVRAKIGAQLFGTA